MNLGRAFAKSRVSVACLFALCVFGGWPSSHPSASCVLFLLLVLPVVVAAASLVVLVSLIVRLRSAPPPPLTRANSQASDTQSTPIPRSQPTCSSSLS